MINIAVFASGSGTNCENLIQYFRQSSVARVVLVITNNPHAGVIEKSAKHNVDCYINPFQTDNDFEVLKNLLAEYNISWIVLAGFLKLVPKHLLDLFPNRVVNIHPALLPDFGGKGMYGMYVHKAVIQSKKKQSGITIHFVNEHYDDGLIIAQYTCPVYDHDTPESLAQRVHELEYKYYPKVVENLLSTK